MRSQYLPLLLFGFAPCIVNAQHKEGDWLQFRGPEGKGVSAAKGVPERWGLKENLLWKKELPGPGTSSPIVIGGRIFLTCYTGAGSGKTLERHLLCFDRKGNLVWDKGVPAQLPEQERIREDHGYAPSTPLSDGERIYVFFGKTGVFAFSLEGEQLWQADVGSELNGWGTANSPILYQDLVIVNASVESGALVALDRKSGKEHWRARGISESWNTPILVKTEGGKIELVVAIMGKVLGFDPVSGGPLWSCATDIPWYMVPSLVSHEGVVYCIGGRGTGGALAVKTGGKGDVTKTHRLWKLLKGSNVPSPLFHEGHLYWAHETQSLFYCVDAKSGTVVYEERFEKSGQIYASPVLVGDKIIYLSRQGTAVVLPARPEFKVLEVNDLRERSTFNASPAVADDRLYIRSDRFLYCIGKE